MLLNKSFCLLILSDLKKFQNYNSLKLCNENPLTNSENSEYLHVKILLTDATLHESNIHIANVKIIKKNDGVRKMVPIRCLK